MEISPATAVDLSINQHLGNLETIVTSTAYFKAVNDYAEFGYPPMATTKEQYCDIWADPSQWSPFQGASNDTQCSGDASCDANDY